MMKTPQIFQRRGPFEDLKSGAHAANGMLVRYLVYNMKRHVMARNAMGGSVCFDVSEKYIYINKTFTCDSPE